MKAIWMGWLLGGWVALAGGGLRAAAPVADVPLSTLRYEIAGSRLHVSPASVSVPKGVAGSIRVDAVGTEVPATGTYVEAILRGPAFPARRLVGRVNEPLLLPVISLVGDYQLDGIRLVDAATGATRLEGVPSSIPVHVFDEVLVSKVTSRPLTLQEIQDRGIVIDQDNFRAVEFEVGFVLDGQTVPIRFPVVAPEYKQNTDIIPAAELQKRLVTAAQINADIANNLANLPLPAALDRPGLNVQLKGINFQPATVDETSLRLPIPPIPALMVIPGNVGYLNQFFSVQIFTENGAPSGSGLSVLNVNATLKLPPGPDGTNSTEYSKPGDDPLRFARVGPNREMRPNLPILGPAPTRLARFNPGEGGSAEFLVEGLQEGLHVMDIDLAAELDGLAAGVVKVQGKAAGSVLVRNPRFSLGFSHPRTVRAGEPYEARVTVLNTGVTEANLLRVTLRNGSLSGGVLQSPEVVELGTLAPGASATATWRVLPQRTGQVGFSNLTTGEDSVAGRFNLRMGIDERGVELSPDVLAMPDLVTNLPPALVDAANRVLGQALSVATAAQLPPGVAGVSRNAVVARALELAEAGQRLRYGDAPRRVFTDLMLDWQGGRTRSEGLDQILAVTDAGAAFRQTLAGLLELAGPAEALARLDAAAEEIAGRGEAWWIATAPGARAMEVPTYAGPRGEWAVQRGNGPTALRWSYPEAVANASVRALHTTTNGTGRLLTWSLGNLPAGSCAVFQAAGDSVSLDVDCDGTLESRIEPTVVAVQELLPGVIAVLQDTAVQVARPYPRCSFGPANNYGNVLAVVFSKPFTQEQVDHPEAFTIDGGNGANAVRIQQGGRVALISLNEPISAILPRTLSIHGIADGRGNRLDAGPLAIGTGFADGVSLRGRVLRADGNPAVGVPVTVTFHDPYRDPFDRCDPVVETSIAQKFTDTNGVFRFDFVHGGVGVTIAAVDTLGLPFEFVRAALTTFKGDQFAREKLLVQIAQSNLLAQVGLADASAAVALAEGLDRAVWNDYIAFDGGRMGHETVIGLRFRGRGTVLGTVVTEDGTPVARAAVNVFPDSDSRERPRGIFSDAQGRFEFRGVPLGNYTLQVKTGLGQFRTVAGLLKDVGGTNQHRIELASPAASPVVRTTVRGRVTEPDHLAGIARARVFVSHLDHGLLAELTADSEGNWELPDVPVGTCQVQAFSADSRRTGRVNFTAIASGVAHVEVALDGTGLVKGKVRTASGQPVAGALIAGGETLVRSEADGTFTLTGVPLGIRRLQALWEANRAPGGMARLGSASVSVLPGSDNFAVIEMRPVGRIVGRVFDARGQLITDPEVKVAIPTPGGFFWAKLDPDSGVFVFPNISPGSKLTLVAPAPPVDELEGTIEELSAAEIDAQEQLNRLVAAVGGAVTSAIRRVDPNAAAGEAVNPGKFGFADAEVRFDGETVSVDIHYLPTGTITGRVLNDQGVPIGARVRATAYGVKPDATVGMTTYGDRTSDAATGEFRYVGIPVGPWGLQAASPFYNTVLTTSGRTSQLEPDVVDAVLQFPPRQENSGRLGGVVLMPDGTRAGANVNVRINFSADYAVRTDTNGFFDTQIQLPARQYTVEAIDPLTGFRGQLQTSVRAGVSNFVTVPLLGKGSLVARVQLANGQPAVGASVRAQAQGYPGGTVVGVTGADGSLRFDNLFVGNWSLYATLNTGAAGLEGRGGGEVKLGADTTVSLRFGGTAALRGTFVRLSDGAPIPFARVSVGNSANVATDAAGRFEVTGLALATYRVVARDPLDGRVGVGSVTLATDGQQVEIRVVELARGVVKGQVLQTGKTSPASGAQVFLEPDDPVFPAQQVTTAPDGSYEFVSVGAGGFRLFARGQNQSRSSPILRATMPGDGGVLILNPSLPPDEVRGTVVVRVLGPDGAVSPFARLRSPVPADADVDGVVRVDGLRLGSHDFLVTGVGNQSSSSAVTNLVLSEATPGRDVTVRLSGVNRIEGQVVGSNGTTAAGGAEVSYEATSGPLRFLTRSTLADMEGRFVFDNLPTGSYRLVAKLAALVANDAGQFTNGLRTNRVTLKLGPSAGLAGRLVRAGGTNAVPGVPVALTFRAPSGLDGIAQTQTGDDGRFRFLDIPVGISLRLQASVQVVNGLVDRTVILTTNGENRELGDVALDEDWPVVASMSPAAGDADVPTTSRIDLTFSEALSLETVTSLGFKLRSPTTNVPVSLSLVGDAKNVLRVVRIIPNRPLVSQTTYQLIVHAGEVLGADGSVIGRGPNDLVGRPLLQPYVASFTTRDDDAPVLLSVSPANHAESVQPGAVVRFSLNEPVRPDGISVSVNGPSGVVSGRVDVGSGGRTVVFTPLPDLAINASYLVRLDGVRDLAGNPLPGQPLVFRFSTLDTLGPVIRELRLAHGALPVAGALVELEAELVEGEPGVSVRFTREGQAAGTAAKAPYRVAAVLPEQGRVRFGAIARDRFGNDGPVAEIDLEVVPATGSVEIQVPPTIALQRGQFTNLIVRAVSPDAAVIELAPAVTNALPYWADINRTTYSNAGGTAGGTAEMDLTVDSSYAEAGTYRLTFLARTAGGAFASTNVVLEVADTPGMQITRWKEPVNGNWRDTNRWTAGLPAPNRPAIIDVPGEYTITTVAFVPAYETGAIRIGGAGSSPRLVVDRTLTNNATVRVLPGATLSMTGGSIYSGLYAVGGLMEFEEGYLRGPGRRLILPDGVLRSTGESGGAYIHTGRLEQYGTMELNGHNAIDLWDAELVNDGVMFVRREYVAVGFANTSPIPRLLNRNLIVVDTDSTARTAGSLVFDNQGTVQVRRGILGIEDGGTNSGVMQVELGGVLSFNRAYGHAPSGTIRGDGRVDFAAGVHAVPGPVGPIGSIRFGPASVIFEQPVEILNGQLALTSGGSVTLQAAQTFESVIVDGFSQLRGAGDVTVTRDFRWGTGTLDGTGQLRLTEGVLAQTLPGTFHALNRRLLNRGIFRWTDAGAITFGNAVFDNRGTFRVDAPTAVLDNRATAQGGRFLNQGLFVQAGTNTTRFNGLVGFENTGTLRIERGAFQMWTTSTNRGRIEVLGDGAFLYDAAPGSGAQLTLGEGTEFAGTGRARFSGPLLRIAVPVNFGALQVQFEPQTPILFGNGAIANTAGGVIEFLKSGLTFAGDLDIGGTVRVVQPAVITRSVTLRDGGVLDNVANNFRVGAWTDEGGLVLGAPPVVTGLPPGAGKVAFTGLTLTGDTPGVRPQSAGPGMAAVLEWVAPSGSRCTLEGSADFKVWAPVNATVAETRPGQFRAVLNGTTVASRFFRLRLDTSEP